MTCYHPIRAYRLKDGKNENGKWPLTFDRNKGLVDMPVDIPCGKCVGCLLERSRQWAVRLMHEASLHHENVFLTLTYDDDHLPEDGSLHKEDFQLFMKRLRKHLVDTNRKIRAVNAKEGSSLPLYNERIRFFHCGEYGGQTGRPHYHAIIFGYRPKDCVFYKSSRGSNLWLSNVLNRLWNHGFVVIGDVSFQSCAYVARYMLKKVSGEKSLNRYTDKSTGVVRQKEYVTMSRRPGIAADWFKKFRLDTYPRDEVLMNDHTMKPPRFYDKKLEAVDPEEYRRVLSQRRKDAADMPSHYTDPDRLAVREKVRLARTSSLTRPLDDKRTEFEIKEMMSR